MSLKEQKLPTSVPGSEAKVAVVHYWLVGMRGGERVLESILDIYPQAVVITHVYDKSKVSEKIRRHEVRETIISKLPMAKRLYKAYLPFMPLALELVDVQEFDIIISSESGPSKGIVPRPDSLHICYCHSPMRYIWDQYHVYKQGAGIISRILMSLISHRLRIWDVTSAARVDKFVANSNFVASRIRKYYRRNATVIFPPVDIEEYEISPSVSDFYLLAGELVSYKRPEMAVRAFNKTGRKLVVVGSGPEMRKLKEIAKDNVEFVGRVGFAELKQYFATCKALIFPGEEDFGIIPVEVMASGRPVVAYRKGGALDTVLDGQSGVFFDEVNADSLNKAIDQLEMSNLLNTPEKIRETVLRFSTDRFRKEFAECVDYSSIDLVK